MSLRNYKNTTNNENELTGIWTGGIFLKHEGGYEIVLQSLKHYQKRLKTINDSPELQNSAAMFASVLNAEARKTVPKIDGIIDDVKCLLEGQDEFESLHENVSLLRRALSCYKSDIQKARDTGNDYFLNLVGDLSAAEDNLNMIDVAMKKLEDAI